MESALVLAGFLAVLALVVVPILLVVTMFSVTALKRRVASLEENLLKEQFARAVSDAAAPAKASAPVAPVPAAEKEVETSADTVVAVEATVPEALAPNLPPPLPPKPRPGTPHPSPVVARVPLETASQSRAWTPPPPAEPNFVERGFAQAKRWITSGNVPVKVGMLVLLAGVAAFLKYATDQGWMRLPIELRLAGVSAAALAGLVFAWRKRESHRSFALALQGGAIGILLLTVFAAFKNYQLIGPVPAFAISVLLIAGLSVMAVLQNSRTLAILGVLAGFMAPIWLSDGSGNHVGLFSYYAVLNAGIFAIAWVKPWRILNLLGFVFTWGIGTIWGVLQYNPAKFNSTEPFLLLFFAFYLLLPILYARKAPTQGSARIDGALLFGTPLIALSLQAGLLQGERMPLALCALGLGALYAVLGRLLIEKDRLRLLAQGYAILAVGFATLAVPLALSAKATASVFALEGAGLVWLGLAQNRALARWTGLGLQLAAAFAFSVAIKGGHGAEHTAIANASFMSALLIGLAGIATAWLYRRAGEERIAGLAYVWGLAWWLGNAANEIGAFVAPDSRLHALLVLAGVTGWVAAEVQRRAPAVLLSLTTLGGLVAAFPLALAQVSELGQPFAGYGGVAWAIFALLGVRSLHCLRSGDGTVAGLAQLVWWLLWPTVLSLLAWHIGDRFELAEGWVALLLALPWLAVALLSMRAWQWMSRPLGEAFQSFRLPLQVLVFAALGLWWFAVLSSGGSASPLPWIAVFNPLDLAQIAVLVLLAMRLWGNRAVSTPPLHILGLALASLLLVTVITLRAVHHWGGEAWNVNLLGTQLAQTSLTVVWSLLGVVGWVSGSRRGQWGLWLAGAILMGVVLAKLLLVDRGNLGELLGIGAFIAYGLLCTLVGWLAPAPPRRGPAPVDSEEESIA